MPPVIAREQRILVLGIMVVSLWSTVGNVISLSVAFVVLAPLVVLALPKNRTLPRTVMFTLALYAYFLISTILYAPESLVAADFYRRDGNFYITFLPILIGGVVAIKIDVESIVRSFVKWASALNLIFLCIFLVTGGTIFYQEDGIYHFLFESHNAAGGYLSMVIAFVLGIFFSGRKSIFWGAILLVDVASLYFTISRGSQLALILSVFLVLGLKERFSKTVVVSIALVTAAVLSYTYPHWLAVGRPNGWADVGAVEGVASGDANILDRVLYLWPRALDLFFRSPIVGTGFGSFDDLPYRFTGVPYLFSYNRPAELTFSSAHAHNSYLHILAETGLVGFVLTICVLHAMRKDIESFAPKSLQLGMRLAIWIAIFSSVTEHRLFTPSQMLPYTIVLGLALADSRWRAAHSQKDEQL